MIVSPSSRALVAVKPTVQVERAPRSLGRAGERHGASGGDAARIVTGVAFAAIESLLVLTVSVDEPGDVFVTPAIVRDAAVLGGRAQVPPLFASVIVATAPAPVAVAEQFEKPATERDGRGRRDGEAGGEGGGDLCRRLLSAPVEVGVKLTVQLARA